MSNILKRLNNAANGKKETRKNDEDFYTPPLMETYEEPVASVPQQQNTSTSRPATHNQTSNSVLTPDVKFVGEIEFSKSLTIFGYVKGSIKTDGTLLLEQGSDINASINADTLTVCGNFQGNINAKSNIKLLSNAIVSGTLKSRSIQVEDGVTFVGEAQISTK